MFGSMARDELVLQYEVTDVSFIWRVNMCPSGTETTYLILFYLTWLGANKTLQPIKIHRG